MFPYYVPFYKLNQTGHDFGFGMAVNSDLINDPSMQNYQNFVYDNFNWATISNALKWRLMEWTQVRNVKRLNVDPTKIKANKNPIC